MGAGAGNKEAPVPDKLHAPEVDLPVAPGGGLYGIAGLGKGGGIQDDHVVELLLGVKSRQELENVRHLIVYDTVQAVEGRVLPGLFDGQVRCVHGKDMGSAGNGGVEAEGSGMGKAVQNVRSPADLMDGPAVVLLVQEKAGLLAVFHVHDVADAVFRDGDLCIKGLCQKSLEALQAFLFPYLGVAPFIDAPDLYAVFGEDLRKGRKDISLDPLAPQGQGFHYQDILVLVHGQAGQKVGFPEDDPAGGGVDDVLSVFPGTADSFL